MPTNKRPRSGPGPGRGTSRTRAGSRPQTSPRNPRGGAATTRRSPARTPRERPDEVTEPVGGDAAAPAKNSGGKGDKAKQSKPAGYVSTAGGTTATDRIPATGADAERSERGLGLTRRAIALFVVLAILAISYASSLRIYLNTERDNAAYLQSIASSQEHIDELNSELARWEDPDYVRAQARERLGWVQPGDTGYRAIGPDGKPYGHQIDTVGSEPTNEPPPQWWAKMWGSVRTADEPAPVPEPVDKPEPPPITISGAPPITPTPTPTKKP